MNPHSDTLDISPLRPAPDGYLAPDRLDANHDGAAAARAQIASSSNPDSFVISEPPAATNNHLVTDRRGAARLAAQSPLVRPQTIRGRKVPSVVRPMLSAVGIFLLLLLLMKSPVVYNEITYALNQKSNSAQAQQASATSLISADPTISIPKINVYAPVVYEPSVNEANVQKALEHGVVHYGNTPNPGEGGNSVLFGHSSNDWWEPGDYKFIFGLLEKVSPGDRFSVDYKSVRYIYEVTGTKVVPPTQVDVLNPTKEPTMTLITCTPPGTSLNRLIITAKQIDPAPATQVAAKSAVKTAVSDTKALPSSDLPGAPSGFLDQLGQAVAGIVNSLGSMFGLGNETASPAAVPAAAGSLPGAK